jgi:hypothetical protein
MGNKIKMLLFLLHGILWLPVLGEVFAVSKVDGLALSDQTISFDYLPDRRLGDPPFVLIASASSGLPVHFRIISGNATIQHDTVTLTGAGTVVIRAFQEGNAQYAAAPEVERSFNVNKANQVITFDDVPNLTLLQSPYQLSALSNSGLPVELSVASGPATVSGTWVNLKGEGLVTIRAYQAGNDLYNSAPYVSQSFHVSKVEQTITFLDLSERVQAGDDFALLATSSSGLPVTCQILSGPAAMRNSTIVTLLGIGRVRVQATQVGNNFYYPASIDSFFCIRPVKPFITAQGLILNSSSLYNNQWFLDGKLILGADTRALQVSREGSYTVQVINPDPMCGSSAMSDPLEVSISSLEKVTSSDWNIAPNPVQDYICIQAEERVAKNLVSFVLYNYTGQIVAEQKAMLESGRNCLMPVAHLPAGVYSLQIKAEKRTEWKKVLIR